MPLQKNIFYSLINCIYNLNFLNLNMFFVAACVLLFILFIYTVYNIYVLYTGHRILCICICMYIGTCVTCWMRNFIMNFIMRIVTKAFCLIIQECFGKNGIFSNKNYDKKRKVVQLLIE